jgi:ribosomal protein L11 methyltransferase
MRVPFFWPRKRLINSLRQIRQLNTKYLPRRKIRFTTNSYIMDYVELSCTIEPFTQIFADLLIGELAEIGYDSFEHELSLIKAYIPAPEFDLNAARNIEIATSGQYGTVSMSYTEIPAQNWNALWESSFQPVIIQEQISVRAAFHPKPEGVKYDIVIEPKMSFGTGHHQTTMLVLQALAEAEIEGKNVADCGCGTGVLGIFASMRGACKVYAFDTDDWAWQNTVENAERNNAAIEAEIGDLSLLQGKHFDIVVANINRNILIAGMSFISAAAKPKGIIIFSGFFTEDLEIMSDSASEYGFKLLSSRSLDNWCCAIYAATHS